MKPTQLEFVKRQLRETGEVSRNFCLRNYISRLGARIADLKREGYRFDVERREGDYVYKLHVEAPPVRIISNIQPALFTKAQM